MIGFRATLALNIPDFTRFARSQRDQVIGRTVGLPVPMGLLAALAPRRISYRTGGYITAGLALVMTPWKILESTQNYIFTWLVGYSALLGPIAGGLVGRLLPGAPDRATVEELYRHDGAYSYGNGSNNAALAAFALGVLPNMPGFLNAAFPATFPDVGEVFKTIYAYAWFVGVAIAALVYWLLMRGRRSRG